MPEKKTTQRARRDRRQGKKASTQAGHYVGEEMRHKKSGKHPVKNRKQAVAIGLSKARRAGVKVPRKKSTAKSSGTKRKTKRPKATRTRAKSTRKSATSGHTKRKGSSRTKRSGSASKSRSSRSQSKKS